MKYIHNPFLRDLDKKSIQEDIEKTLAEHGDEDAKKRVIARDIHKVTKQQEEKTLKGFIKKVVGSTKDITKGVVDKNVDAVKKGASLVGHVGVGSARATNNLVRGAGGLATRFIENRIDDTKRLFGNQNPTPTEGLTRGLLALTDMSDRGSQNIEDVALRLSGQDEKDLSDKVAQFTGGIGTQVALAEGVALKGAQAFSKAKQANDYYKVAKATGQILPKAFESALVKEIVKGVGVRGASYALARGGLGAIGEGGQVLDAQVKQGASFREADSAMHKAVAMQLPIQIASEGLAEVFGGSSVIKNIVARGLSNAGDAVASDVVSGVLSQRKRDGSPYTWGDLVNAVPEMASAVPEAMYRSGIPALVAGGIVGGMQGGYRQNSNWGYQKRPSTSVPDDFIDPFVKRIASTSEPAARTTTQTTPMAPVDPAVPQSKPVLSLSEPQVKQPRVVARPDRSVVTPDVIELPAFMGGGLKKESAVNVESRPLTTHSRNEMANVPADFGTPTLELTGIADPGTRSNRPTLAGETFRPQGAWHESNVQQNDIQVNKKDEYEGIQDTPTRRLANKVLETLERGEGIKNNKALVSMSDEAYGGTQGEGRYSIKDAYDAMELGVNKFIEKKKYTPSLADSIENVKKEIEDINSNVMDKLPTQANRTEEQIEFQQFSTPPSLSYVANWLLQAKKGDTVLEPSAGIGGLAVFAKNAGARVVVNEISARRADILRDMGFDEVYTENGELIDNILPETVKPNKVIMNPPFSSTAGRIKGKTDTKNATLHVEQALARLEDGGRAVMILGKGMADDAPAFKGWWGKIKKQYNVRANIEMSGKDYRKYGTTFGNVMVVVDKTGPTPHGGTLAGKYDSVMDALGDLEPIRLNATAPIRNIPDTEVHRGAYRSIQDLVKATVKKEGQAISGSMYVDYGKINDSDAIDIKKAIGVDVVGYTRRLNGSGIIHSLKEHSVDSPKTKQYPNAVPLRAKDFELLPQIVTNPNETLPGNDDSGPNGEPRFKTVKNIGEHKYTVVQQVNSRDRTVTITMWKEKIEGDAIKEQKPPSHTPKNVSGLPDRRVDAASALKSSSTDDGDFHNKSVAQKGNKVKSDSSITNGKNVSSLRYEWGEKKLPTGVTWGKSAVYTAKSKYVEGDPIYNKVEFLPIGDDMLIRLTPAKILNKESRVLTIKDYKQHKATDLIREFCSDPKDTLGRHFNDGVLKLWKEAGVKLGWAETPGQKQEDSKQNNELDIEKVEKTVLEEDNQVDNCIYSPYTPAKARVKGAKKHPAKLVESLAMASVSPPDVTYKPKLPKKVIDEGLLSEAQLEAIVYAGQSFETINKNGTRRGFFIGDGTGVGKGREISGIITDQLAQGAGNGKAVWVSMKTGLVADAKRDWEGIGNDPNDVFGQGLVNVKDAIPHKKGVAFTAYSTIREEKRFNQLKAWLGEDFDGVIALDEVHNANNAMDNKGERGTQHASKQALAVINLVEAFPKARVLYVSATGATEVRNLAMLDRLGLWGEGTSFASRNHFIAAIEKGGTAAMELVARDMKAMGLYVARSISFDGVEYERLEHELSPPQIAVYDRIAEGWQNVLNNIDKAIEVIVGNSKKGKSSVRSAALSQFWGAHQRCFNQVVTSMQTPAMINSIETALKNGKSVIIQLTNTNEADQKRAVARLTKDETLDDLDITPRDTLMSFVQNSFPVAQMQEVEDDNGNIRLVQALDSKGNPIFNKEAVKMRDELLTDLALIKFPESPLDMIIKHFGTDNVAEITGRTERFVMKDGKRVRERLSPRARQADKQAFQDGQKRIAVFSEAGGTGFSLHSDLNAKNQQQRYQYVLQPGWKADSALQGMGRSHRSNQKSTPKYVLMTTDLPGQKRFVSTIAKRLEQLGALTSGERKASSGGLFSEKDNLESVHAQKALVDLMMELTFRGTKTKSPEAIFRELGMSNILDERGMIIEGRMPKIQQFLNRMLSLTHAGQKEVFDLFNDYLEAEVSRAEKAGELDVGTETMRADAIEVMQEQTVYVDELSGAQTKYIEIETATRQYPLPFTKVEGFKFYRSNTSGRVFAARKTSKTKTIATTGEVLSVNEIRTVDPKERRELTDRQLDNADRFTPLSDTEGKKEWTKASKAFPEFKKERRHLISGVMLPVWEKIGGHPRIYRVVTKSGDSFLGRLVSEKELPHTLARLGAKYKSKPFTMKDIDNVFKNEKGVLNLSNGMSVKESLVNGERRFELLNASYEHKILYKNFGIFSEMISFKPRLFVPSNDGNLERFVNYIGVVSTTKDDYTKIAVSDLNAGKDDFDLADYAGFTIKERYKNILDGNDFVSKVESNEKPYVFADTETEKRFSAAKAGVIRETFLQKMTGYVNSIREGFKSDFPLLDSDHLIEAKEFLRKMNRQKGAAVHKAVLTLKKTVKDMSPNEFDIFTRKRILDDLVYSVQENPEMALPFGFSKQSLEEEYNNINDALDGNVKIASAIDWEENVIKSINKDMVDLAHKLGWHSLSEKFKNPHYYRHVVLEYANATTDGSRGLKAPDGRGYMKKRFGSSRDISTNYIQAMGEVRALQLQDIEAMKALIDIKKSYDKSDSLKRMALAVNEKEFLKSLKNMAITQQGIDPDQAAEWAIDEYNKLNKPQARAITKLFDLARNDDLPVGEFGEVANAMAEYSVEEFPQKLKKQLNRYIGWLAGLGDDESSRASRSYFSGIASKKKEIKSTLGNKHKTWRDLIPDGYVEWHPFSNQLVFSVSTIPEMLIDIALKDGLSEINVPVDKINNMPVLGGHRQTWVIPEELATTLQKLGEPIKRTALGNIAKGITSQWKEIVLHAPRRVFKYNVRNVIGDADAVLAGNPDSFRYVGRAFHELANVFIKGKEADGDLADYIALGGSVGAQHIQELGDRTTINEFRTLLDKGNKGVLNSPKWLWNEYWDKARTVSDFRENLLRYATYLSYLEQMRAKGTVRNYGASNRKEVEILKSEKDKAFKLSNELLGAYDQVSESGKMIRDIALPFFSWMEVNLKRYGQLFRNAKEDGELKGAVKRTVAGKLLMASLLTIAMQVWNHVVMNDESQEVPPDIRARPHIVLGRDRFGNVLYFDRPGAFADILDWVALDSAQVEIKDILNGHQSISDFAKKMAKAPINKIANAVNPIAKVGAEVASGKRFFPDVFNPRDIRDMGFYLAETLALGQEFIALTGRPSRGYLESAVKSSFVYSLDPDESAYWWIIGKKRQFQEGVLGTTFSGGAVSEKGRALMFMKQALRFGDKRALEKYARRYASFGGTSDGLQRSLKSLHPLYGLSSENQARFLKWLSAEDRRFLKGASNFHQGMLKNLR